MGYLEQGPDGVLETLYDHPYIRALCVADWMLKQVQQALNRRLEFRAGWQTLHKFRAGHVINAAHTPAQSVKTCTSTTHCSRIWRDFSSLDSLCTIVYCARRACMSYFKCTEIN